MVAGRPPGGALSSPSSLVSALPSNSQIQDLGLRLSPPASSCSSPSSPCLPRKGSLGVSARCPPPSRAAKGWPRVLPERDSALALPGRAGRALQTLCDGREKRLRPIEKFWGPPRSSLKAQRQLGPLHRVAEEVGVLAAISSQALELQPPANTLPPGPTLRRLFPVPDPPTPTPGAPRVLIRPQGWR